MLVHTALVAGSFSLEEPGKPNPKTGDYKKLKEPSSHSAHIYSNNLFITITPNRDASNVSLRGFVVDLYLCIYCRYDLFRVSR